MRYLFHCFLVRIFKCCNRRFCAMTESTTSVFEGHLLEMLWTGESVLNFPGTDYHIMWRKVREDLAN